jgi:hypothetical protein
VCQFRGRAYIAYIKHSLLLAVFFAAAAPALGTVTLKLSTAVGGVTISGSSPSFKTGYGNVNGLGVGTPGAGIAILTTGVTGGVFYTAPYDIVLSGLGAHKASVTVYVSTQFAHPTVLYLLSCYPSSGCTTGGSYATISTSAVSPTTVIASPGVANGTYIGSLALFVSNANGSGTFTGSDTATLTFTATDLTSGATSTVTLALNTPNETVETAVQLFLATASGGLTISPASDFSTNYGNANGLGVGTPSSGLTLVSAAGGVIYSTPYQIEPSFSSFTSATGTVTVYVSTAFAHPNTLTLKDAASSGGPYTSISTSSSSPTSISTTASSGSTITRYLGLLVASSNGAGAFPGTAGASGADGANLTYTLTVP